jgi:hypothetical protein
VEVVLVGRPKEARHRGDLAREGRAGLPLLESDVLQPVPRDLGAEA